MAQLLSNYTQRVSRTILHRTLEFPIDPLAFITHLESGLGRFDETAFKAVRNYTELEAAPNIMRGSEPFSIYAVYDCGTPSTMAGQPRKAKQYVMGNTLIGTSMRIHDVRAAERAPITMLIHELESGVTAMDYNSAVSIFGGLTDGNEEVLNIGESIEERWDRWCIFKGLQ